MFLCSILKIKKWKSEGTDRFKKRGRLRIKRKRKKVNKKEINKDREVVMTWSSTLTHPQYPFFKSNEINYRS